MHEPHSIGYLWLIPALPLAGALLNGLGGWWLQKRAGRWLNGAIANVAVWGAFLVAVSAFATLRGLEPEHRFLVNRLFTWISAGSFETALSFAVDPLSAVMMLVVTGVGGLIHLYSVGYMAHDKSVWRYFSYLNLFTFAMLVLVLADNLLLMFVGWEGVGLCSYLLIGFWYDDVEKAKAGMKAFIVNRVGDFAFLVGLMLLLWGAVGYWDDAGRYTLTGGTLSLDFKWLASITGYLQGKEVLGISIITAICVLMFVGATGKSAQLPLYVWLPDAMAGPTPVSALIHAATMVTAGVYMVARLNFLFALSPAALTVVSGVGAATALFSATIGFAQRDIKKVLAYSTVSQLGFMFIGVGVGAFTAGIFHLMTHAFFKACLFLGAGSVIHAMSGEQDAFKMGGLRKKMPYTFSTFLVATLAIAGIPGLAGFFSKDEILWRAFDTENPVVPWWPYLVWGLGAVAALGTAFYMFRIVYLTFYGECRADEETKHHIHESPWTMTLPLVVLAFFAVVSGYLGMPGVTGLPNVFEHWLEPVFAQSAPHITSREAGHGAEIGLMALSVILALTGIALATKVYYRGQVEAARRLSGRFPLIHTLVFNKYYVDELYGATVVKPFVALTRVLGWIDARIVDGIVNLVGRITAVFSMIDGWIDLWIVDGMVNLVAAATIAAGRRIKHLQTGRLQDYLYTATSGAVLVLVLSYVIARMG